PMAAHASPSAGASAHPLMPSPIGLGPMAPRSATVLDALERVDWFNNRRLLKPFGNIPPAEAEANYYTALATEVRAV
ncbi:MAG: hypothetical protein ACK4RN_16685, partial [Pseudorhodobacter sp.]